MQIRPNCETPIFFISFNPEPRKIPAAQKRVKLCNPKNPCFALHNCMLDFHMHVADEIFG